MTRMLAARAARLALACLVAALAATALIQPAWASPAKVGPPNSIDVLGDSISRAFQTGTVPLTDAPQNSWASGTTTSVNSVYLRIRAINPAINGNNLNHAVTGAKVAGINAQAANAVASHAEAVYILIGANDVCTSTEAGMTSVADFRSRFNTAMSTLSSGLPDSRIVVSSIPNIFNLWNIGRVNSTARLIWSLGSICQSMLANPTSFAQADVDRRARVQQRNIDFNTQLQQVCAQYIHCHYDGGAAYALNFVLADVSTNDYFHPNLNGQAKAAATAWTAGPSYADVTAPTTTISTDRPADGVDDWYRNDVTVTLSAADGNDPVNGSEYFYKLQGAADAPWTRYTAPISIGTEGVTEVDARSVDSNGNVEASKLRLVKIDKTAPSFSLSCPAAPVLLNTSASYAIQGASDDRSGFAQDPNGSYPLDTSVPGSNPNTVQVEDKAGNTASRSCNYDVAYPDPGTPQLSSGLNPNSTGVFGLAWTASADPAHYPIRYALEHRDANDAGWSSVDASLATADYAFTNGSPEGEGTWTYRVKGHDGALETGWSAASDPVKVDLSAPGAPSIALDPPDYTGGGGWFRDAVTATFSDNGDPNLQDGSAGSGVDSSSVPSPVTEQTSGSHAISGAVSDLAGNQSALSSTTVQVDADAPSLSATCSASVLLYAPASASVSASDGESGLASDPSGSYGIDTSQVGPQILTYTASDNVGHTTTKSCTTQVQYMFGGLLQPVNPDGSSIFKLGSTVPLKFRLTDYNSDTAPAAVAHVDVAKVSSDVDGTFAEAESTSAATTGSLFRYDAQQYVFNLSTKSLSTGTWSVRVTLDDGTSYRTRISLR